jgi:hypothetical protein
MAPKTCHYLVSVSCLLCPHLSPFGLSRIIKLFSVSSVAQSMLLPLNSYPSLLNSYSYSKALFGHHILCEGLCDVLDTNGTFLSIHNVMNPDLKKSIQLIYPSSYVSNIEPCYS